MNTKRDEILREAAGLTGIDEANLEIHDDKIDAIAVAIYVTHDREDQPLKDGDSVVFSDDKYTVVGTGPYADGTVQGLKVYLVPDGGVYTGEAMVDWIRRRPNNS